MKILLYNIESNSSNLNEVPTNGPENKNLQEFFDSWYQVDITIPILPALSVLYFGIYRILGVEYHDKEVQIDEKTISFCVPYSLKDSGTSIAIYYSGIRDFDQLFHWVADIALRKRLGEFYEEAEKDFDNASWLSYSLMCGAIFEGVLFAKGIIEDSFYKSIEVAASKEPPLIDDRTKSIMHMVREFRNLVHANKYSESYITRANAMDIRSVLDKLIISF